MRSTSVRRGWHALWRSKRRDQGRFELPFFGNGWYYDILITRLMGGPGRIAADAMAWFDRTVIDGAVNGIGIVSVESSSLMRRVQSGYLRRYALALALGSAVLLAFVATRVVNL